MVVQVFSTPPTRIYAIRDQEILLDIREKGKLTAELNASAIFPDLFGPLTDEDVEKYFSGIKLKRWTRAKTVLGSAQSISKRNGIIQVMNGNDVNSSTMDSTVFTAFSLKRRLNCKEGFIKLLNERRS